MAFNLEDVVCPWQDQSVMEPFDLRVKSNLNKDMEPCDEESSLEFVVFDTNSSSASSNA